LDEFADPIPGGWLNGHWIQVLYQIADSCAGLAYSFCVTYAILFIMDKIPGLSLRVDEEREARGIDDTELGESAYYHVDRIAATSSLLNHVPDNNHLMPSNNGKLPMQQSMNQYSL
jgi:Amt family ammonium transporter